VPQAIGLVAREAPEPTASEFGLAGQEIFVGVGLADAMRHLAQRTANPDYELMSIIVRVQHEVGMDIDEHQSQTDDAVLKLLGQRGKRRQQRWPGPRVSTGRDASIHLRQRNPVGESEIERGHPFRRKTAPGDPFQASDEHFSDARREAWEFTTPTMTHEFQLFVRTREVAIRRVADLSRRKVGVAPGGFPAEFLQTQPEIALVPIQSYDEGFNGLQSGRLDAVAADMWVGAYIIQRRGLTGIAVAGDPFATVPAGIALKKGRTDLVESINRAIRTVQADGTLAGIQARWRPHEVVFLRRDSVRRYVLFTVGAFAVVILSALMFRVLMLKRHLRATRRIPLTELSVQHMPDELVLIHGSTTLGVAQELFPDSSFDACAEHLERVANRFTRRTPQRPERG